MVDIENIREQFAARLNEALNDHPDLTRESHGRNIDLKKGLEGVGLVTTTQATSKWLRGESMPKKDNMLTLAEWLGVRAEWLEYGVLPKRQQDAWVLREQAHTYGSATAMDSNIQGERIEVRTRSVPVVGKAMLGVEGYFEALDYPTGHGEGVLNVTSRDENAYGLRVVGHSMAPRIKHNEFVLIEPNHSFGPGDEVLVKTVAGQSMIKAYAYLKDGQYRFESINAEYAPVILDEQQVESIQYVGAIVKGSMFQMSE
ncbi:hypothetical protein BVH03_08450 [Pseudomonas sp. PA15(2017)]|uniref:S24 family peptidase n=1 Tax=Pseudomonas sp. PA15(2017) TaxID=1932111 RepID=UPI0009632C82|nr:S24 family peptidase [Pseudomonas sp. PA15(2017)]OLU31493.1 hypothetical protein BVH03_08450 [Pseudomonas sp. PA15(2017)]